VNTKDLSDMGPDYKPEADNTPKVTQPCYIKVKQVGGRGVPLELPTYATSGSAAFDLRSDIAYNLHPGDRYAVPTGLSLEIPEGFEGQVRPRSGLAAKSGITILNSPGTIDSDYRGEVHALLINLSNKPFQIGRGDRIAQMVIAPVTQATLVISDDLSETVRGVGGFGSTGK
jgi:dUTP pyrophosphatase